MPELSPLYHSARAKGRTEDQLRSSNLSRTECTCGPSPFGRSAQSSCNSRPDCLLCPSERRFTISLPPAFSTLAQRVRETLTLTGRKKPPSKEPRRIISLSKHARAQELSRLLALVESGLGGRLTARLTLDSGWV
jgi:hypothetical protein